jgi:hypothetical protein
VKIVIAMLMLLAPLAAHGQLLKCVGKDGKVEYAAQCPPGTKPIQTGIKNAPAAPTEAKKGAAQPKTLSERDADFRKRQAEAAEERQKADEEAARKAFNRESCENAQANLRGLQEGQRITRVDPKTGERVFPDDAERAAEIARAQKIVAATCK